MGGAVAGTTSLAISYDPTGITQYLASKLPECLSSKEVKSVIQVVVAVSAGIVIPNLGSLMSTSGSTK